MAIRGNSKRWLQEHENDYYVKRAKETGYASRAAFKLLEIQEKDHLLKPGMVVVDLGAAPGGWSEVARDCVGDKGIVIALDCLPMPPIAGVTIIQGDFNSTAVLEALVKKVAELTPKRADHRVDVVISDMAPNISGVKSIDQPRSLHLVELAFDCAQQLLRPGGTFLAKIFQGSGTDAFIKQLRSHFKQVKIRKPNASRARSREVYVLGENFLL